MPSVPSRVPICRQGLSSRCRVSSRDDTRSPLRHMPAPAIATPAIVMNHTDGSIEQGWPWYYLALGATAATVAVRPPPRPDVV